MGKMNAASENLLRTKAVLNDGFFEALTNHRRAPKTYFMQSGVEVEVSVPNKRKRAQKSPVLPGQVTSVSAEELKAAARFAVLRCQTDSARAFLLQDGSVLMGTRSAGYKVPDCSQLVQTQDSFACLTKTEDVYSWKPGKAPVLRMKGVKELNATDTSFAALTRSKHLLVWGDINKKVDNVKSFVVSKNAIVAVSYTSKLFSYGDHSECPFKPTEMGRIISLHATQNAFAVRCISNIVFTWGMKSPKQSIADVQSLKTDGILFTANVGGDELQWGRPNMPVSLKGSFSTNSQDLRPEAEEFVSREFSTSALNPLAKAFVSQEIAVPPSPQSSPMLDPSRASASPLPEVRPIQNNLLPNLNRRMAAPQQHQIPGMTPMFVRPMNPTFQPIYAHQQVLVPVPMPPMGVKGLFVQNTSPPYRAYPMHQRSPRRKTKFSNN